MRHIMQVEDCDVLFEIDYRDGTPGWVTLANFGSKGIFLDDNEWDAFVQLVAEVNAFVELKKPSRTSSQNGRCLRLL